MAIITIGGSRPTPSKASTPAAKMNSKPKISEEALKADLMDPANPTSPAHEKSNELQKVIEMRKQHEIELKRAKERLQNLSKSLPKQSRTEAKQQSATQELRAEIEADLKRSIEYMEEEKKRSIDVDDQQIFI